MSIHTSSGASPLRVARRALPGGAVVRGVVGAGMALGLLVGGAVGVGAVPWDHWGPGFGSPSSPPLVSGTVSSAPSSATGSFTLLAHGGTTWTVDLSTSTTYAEPGVSSLGYSSVAVGDEAAVDGTSAGSDTVDATSVWLVQRPVVVGTVATAPSGATGSFTVTAHGGTTWTVDLTGSTSYTERGVASPTYSSVAVGDGVVVFGSSTGTDTVSASAVSIMVRAAVVGTVATAPTSATGSFTVTAWKARTVTVDLTGSTGYTERGVTSPGFSAIGVGDEVVVYGTSAGTDVVSASSVVIIQRPVVQGTVATAPTSATGSFTITARNHQTWTVDLSGSTVYRDHGVSSPGYGDVSVGDVVVVYGTSAGTDTVDAGTVVVISLSPHHPMAPPSPWAVGHLSSGAPSLTAVHVGIAGPVSFSDRGTSSSGGSGTGGHDPASGGDSHPSSHSVGPGSVGGRSGPGPGGHGH